MCRITKSFNPMTSSTPQSEIASESLHQVEPLPVRVALPVVFRPNALHHVKLKILGYAAIRASSAKQQLDMFPDGVG